MKFDILKTRDPLINESWFDHLNNINESNPHCEAMIEILIVLNLCA